MNQRATNLLERTMRFSVDVVRFTETLPQNPAGWTVARQVVRSATSIGANYREAQFARSRAEFLSKAYIALQEASETHYWFELLTQCSMGNAASLERLTDEANQLVAILVTITGNAKRHP